MRATTSAAGSSVSSASKPYMRSMPAAGLAGSRRTPLVLAPRVWHNRAKELPRSPVPTTST